MESNIPSSVVSTVTVRPVRSRRDLSRFIDLPFRLYRENPYWVPPLRRDVARLLNPKKNAFFDHGQIQPFLAEDVTGKVVGRVAAIVNGMHLKKYDDGVGFFGFFECEEHYDVAEALFDAAADWLKTQGLTALRGPANPSLNDTAGLLVDGFDRPPAILMPYNPPCYEEFLLRYGFERAMTMWAYYAHYKFVQTDRMRRGVAIVKRRHPGLRLRTIDMKRFDEEARIILALYNDAWSENWGHVPMTERELVHLAAELKQVIDPRIVYLLEDEGEPVAFSITLPDVNQALRHVKDGRLFPFGLAKLLAAVKLGAIHDARMPLMGVRRDYHGKGLDALLILHTIDNGPPLGYLAAEVSWVLDVNKVLLNAFDNMNAVRDKEYAMFEKGLSVDGFLFGRE